MIVIGYRERREPASHRWRLDHDAALPAAGPTCPRRRLAESARPRPASAGPSDVRRRPSDVSWAIDRRSSGERTAGSGPADAMSA
jgi:hypothetical protein